METTITNNKNIVINGRLINNDEARKILKLLRAKKNACKSKKEKLINRIKLIDRFINETEGDKITLGQWVKLKGLNFKAFYTPMGYYTPLQSVVSKDDENELLSYDEPMEYNIEVGFFVPKRKVVDDENHNIISNSNYGMTYNPRLAQYFPITIYDTDSYIKSEDEKDLAMDIVGGFTVQDLKNLSASNRFAKELLYNVKEFYEEEYDNVSDEEDSIDEYSAQILLGEDFSNASGTRSGANAVCRTKCATSHPFHESKRDKCNSDCDTKYPPSQKQEVRRDDRDDRRDARQDKRDTKKQLKSEYKEGIISKDEYKGGKKDNRKNKRDKIREAGGNLIGRVWKKTATVNPLTLSARGGALILIGLNAFGFATRIAPAILPESEAKKLFKPSSIAKAKIAWNKISRAWELVGGKTDKFKQKLIEGYKKRPYKVPKNSSFNGENEEQYSNIAEGILILAGVSLVTSLMSTLNKSGADKDPYINTPQDYKDSENNGALDPPASDPNSPQYDSEKGEWIDPSTGKSIDPKTGEYTDNILGINKWIVIGLGVILVGGTIILLTRKKGA